MQRLHYAEGGADQSQIVPANMQRQGPPTPRPNAKMPGPRAWGEAEIPGISSAMVPRLADLHYLRISIENWPKDGSRLAISNHLDSTICLVFGLINCCGTLL